MIGNTNKEKIFCNIIDSARKLNTINTSICAAVGSNRHTDILDTVAGLLDTVLDIFEADKYEPIHTLVKSYAFTFNFGEGYNGEWLAIYNNVKYSPKTSKELYNMINTIFLSKKKGVSSHKKYKSQKKPLFENKSQKGKTK